MSNTLMLTKKEATTSDGLCASVSSDRVAMCYLGGLFSKNRFFKVGRLLETVVNELMMALIPYHICVNLGQSIMVYVLFLHQIEIPDNTL